MSEEVVRRLSLTFSENGADATTGKVNKLAEASGSLATVTDTNAKRALSAQAAFDKLTNQIDSAAKAQTAIEKGTRTLNEALAQGVITQEKYNESLALLREKYEGVDDAGDEVTEGFRATGIEAASVANHIKQAAAAAYALSPAFRALVNPLIGAGLSATGAALSAMSPAAAALALNLGQRVAPLLAQIASFALPFALLRAEIALIAFAWSSASEQIDKYNNISKEASANGVSTDFWQRYIKGATDTGLKIDEATASLKKFKEISQEKLGGSDLDQKLEAHLKVGNVSESGLLSVKNAASAEEKYRALTVLLTDMAEQGKRLAAIDIASTFLSPAALENFRRGNDYLASIQENADKIANTKLVNDRDINDAVALKNRYDEAVRILSERWIPFQETITAGGMLMQRTWVGIVELLATAVTGITNFATKVGELIVSIPQMGTALKLAAESALNIVTFGVYGLGKSAVNYLSGPGPSQEDNARSRLASGLSNKDAVSASMSAANGISNFMRGDTSKSLNQDKNAAKEYSDAVDRAINALQKHILVQKADAEAIGLGAGALAEYRAQAIETAAKQANGGKITEDQAAEFARLKVEAKAAAEALAAAQVASEISRGKQLAFASPQDVQIANQLRGLYGDDIPAALNSSEAAALRMVATMKNINDIIKDAAATFVKDFIGGLTSGKSMMESLGAASRSLSTQLTNGAITSLFKGDFVAAGAQGIGAIITGIFGNSQAKKEEERKRQEEERKRVEEGRRRAEEFEAQAKLAVIDTSTVSGQIKAFDINAQLQRAQEARNGNYAIIELEHKLGIERQAIVDKANKEITKSLNDFLNSIKLGSLSTLSPEEQLKAAQGKFNTDYAAAQTGDEEALRRITSDAQTLLEIAKGFYASGTGYASVYDQVTGAVTALASKGNLLTASPSTTQTQIPRVSLPEANMSGYGFGGVVLNGLLGIDSVQAKLAGGEHVTKTSSVNASTLPTLSYINRTGSLPTQSNDEVIRVLSQGFNGTSQAIVEAINGLADRLKRIEDATKQGSTQRRVPGAQKAA